MHKNPFLLLTSLLLLVFSSAAAIPPSANGLISLSPAADCSYNPAIDQLLGQTSPEDWAGWISRLSGVEEVTVAGSPTRILTRSSPTLFSTPPGSAGYSYVLERLSDWYPAGSISEDSYTYSGITTWRNIVLTLPGQTSSETVVLSAHLDSTSTTAGIAPGAEDNASGSAVLLEAARLFRTYHFERTLRLIWFTGEEQGLLGSKAYTAHTDLSNIIGVINLDMFGYDSDHDRCFELHVGTKAVSAPLGACFINAAQAYSPTLKLDLINTYDLSASDHASFWAKGIGALEVLENHSIGPADDACGGISDTNPYYHTRFDTLGQIDLVSGFAITRAALGAAAGLALPTTAAFSEKPTLQLVSSANSQHLAWSAVSAAASYRVYRSPSGCSGDWRPIAETSALAWDDPSPPGFPAFAYRVEALGPDALFASAPSACLQPDIITHSAFIPWISH